MSEQEIKSGGGADPSVMLVDQSTASWHKQAFHPIDIPEDAPKEHHKRSKAPAVPSVKEELKESTNVESKERKESERAITSDKHKHNVASKLSLSTKRRGSSPEAITLAPMVVELKKSSVTPSQPIPAQVSETEVGSDISTVKDVINKNNDDEEKNDSITEEIADMRTSKVAKRSSEWSDEEEAGGLPRSESRASRVSRAVRQLFCCGVAMEPPSEYRMSPRTEDDII